MNERGICKCFVTEYQCSFHHVVHVQCDLRFPQQSAPRREPQWRQEILRLPPFVLGYVPTTSFSLSTSSNCSFFFFSSAEAMKHLPQKKRTLWRGISVDLSEQYKVGSTITWWGVSSCTADESVCKREGEDIFSLFLVMFVFFSFEINTEQIIGGQEFHEWLWWKMLSPHHRHQDGM